MYCIHSGKAPMDLRTLYIQVVWKLDICECENFSFLSPCCSTLLTKADIFTCFSHALIHGSFQGHSSRIWTSHTLVLWLSLLTSFHYTIVTRSSQTSVCRLQIRCMLLFPIFCPISPCVTVVFNCVLGCLFLLAQYMGFYELSESNNWHQKCRGERERDNQPFGCAFPSHSLQEKSCT